MVFYAIEDDDDNDNDERLFSRQHDASNECTNEDDPSLTLFICFFCMYSCILHNCSYNRCQFFNNNTNSILFFFK